MRPVSTRIAIALAGALLVTCAFSAPPGSASSSPPPSGSHENTSKDMPARSGAMHDALDVAMQALRYAAQQPDASEPDKQAKANEIMSRLFQHELHGGAADEDGKAETPSVQDDGG